MVSSVHADRIDLLRRAMAGRKVDACIVLSSDPHLSEYLPDHWQARAWLSGFEGSAGTLLVTAAFAGIWTDSRYWEQAAGDLAGTGIETMRAGADGVPGMLDWLCQHLDEGSRVAVHGLTLSVQMHQEWLGTLQARRIELLTELDLPGDIWPDRPALPAAPLYEHQPPFACRSRAENLAAVRQAMQREGARWHWISSLDDIAWLLNLRGSDVSYNPVFLAHALLGQDEVRLFVDESRVDAALRQRLQHDGVRLLSYEDAGQALAGLPAGEKVLIDPARTTVGITGQAGAELIHALNPSQLLKSRKNDAEIDHVRRAMEQDGAALCEFFAWFESALGTERITELTIDEKITQARARREHFVSPSFSTIAAYRANGAMPHYHATPQSHAVIEGDGLLLIDSGGQYLGGTTDITRVVPVGNVDAEQKRDYTLVLKGMISLSQAVFPVGVAGSVLDAFARQPIWQALADFGHGTGHGVGYFLNVHEGPQSISFRAPSRPSSGMQEGMITSNEPGLYRPGKWGIRIENLVANRPAGTSEFGRFLQFETLTLCPIDTRCVLPELLTEGERNWLNAYHAHVRERLEPLVEGAALAWLEERTQAL
ncbi:aminopeptidase P family protein [Pusillimonas noertemannii]|uniref:Xaa-Pro aminopeptidase n=1 Tax=Pusillimonas noertemannii TaxID=305977 RepID=A0A2U1CSA4_9BURK|nr:aminopeptidase P family protein [Pusillimonas noertemannii]NYT68099.1 aminopeptidase P family protein [Pusillimonas noertemannii]PVY68776.1 Xaa-Pro aminopeptidase [Pusillimonas noertemannii]TFL11768.1 aminopeptidase P family protein [Pusillimonas noertemannii]